MHFTVGLQNNNKKKLLISFTLKYVHNNEYWFYTFRNSPNRRFYAFIFTLIYYYLWYFLVEILLSFLLHSSSLVFSLRSSGGICALSLCQKSTRSAYMSRSICRMVNSSGVL